jgi:hypothetical protein
MNDRSEPPASIELDLDEALLLVVAFGGRTQNLRAPAGPGSTSGR